MKLLTKALEAKLRKNAETHATDFAPVVKLFTPWTGCTWLLSELDENGIAFGLCDLGQGFPEMGYVSLEELEAIRGPFGLKIERDLYFRPSMTLTEYAAAAAEKGYVAA